MSPTDQPHRLRRIALHGVRVLLFAATLGLIHSQHARITARQPDRPLFPVDPDLLRRFFPDAKTLAEKTNTHGGRDVLDGSGRLLGYVVETSPDSDHLIGFSGPTNTLIAFSPNDRIAGLGILSSGDTRDHVARIRRDEAFLHSLDGLSWKEAAKQAGIDGVSGATLTSLAIREAIIHRLSGNRRSLRFPDPLSVSDARSLFKSATAIRQDADCPSLWHVRGNTGGEIGTILRTSPAADNIIGFQGPTETRIGFGSGGRIIGIAIGNSYDNEPYVTYVRDDRYFLTLFNGLLLDELARLDLEEAEVEGVSGATMTSMAVAKGLLVAAEQHRQSLAELNRPRKPFFTWSWRDLGTAVVIAAGLVIALTSLGGNKRLRVAFQCVLIGYLGLVNGDMLSQAMIAGWAENGVPWRNAGGLVLLTLTAFLVPLTTRRNAYCTHLCPHGAAQQLLKNRLPFSWRWRLPRKLSRALKMIPALLLFWSVVVTMRSLPFSLVDIEPFDAWVFRVAGWASITVAALGLVASLFVPLAYCRYGCPTGAILSFLRRNSRSDRWSRRDGLAVGLFLLACALWIAG